MTLVSALFVTASTQASQTQIGAAVAPIEAVDANDFDAWARDLVAPTLGRSGDRDAIVAGWFDRLEAQPKHALAEATVFLLRAVRADLSDPPAFRRRVARLDPEAFDPWTRHQLELLQGRGRADLPGAGAADLYPGLPPAVAVLGPLAPLSDPRAFALDPERLLEPGLGREHAGLDGPVSWTLLERTAVESRPAPATAFPTRDGWALMALRFDVPAGGQAWIEIDLGAGSGGSVAGNMGAVFSYGGTGFRGHVLGAGSVPVGYTLCLNGGRPETVDLSSGAYGAVQHHGVVLADGRNQLVIRFSLESPISPRVRVLDGSGSSWTGLSWAHDDRAPGPTRRIAAPGPWPHGSQMVLANLAAPSPYAQALRGLLAALHRRPAQGLADLLAALDRVDDLALVATVAGIVDRMAYLPNVWRRGRSRELIERVRREDEEHLPMGMAWASILTAEDKDEEAIALLLKLADAWPTQPDPLLRLRGTYSGLEMEAQAREALFSARDRAPASPKVLSLVSSFWTGEGFARRALDADAELQAAVGITASGLEGRARRLAANGDLPAALAAWDKALQRGYSSSRRLRHARFLMGIERLDQAETQLQALCEQYPDWSSPFLARADRAGLAGDGGDELAALREVLDRSPSSRVARERLAALLGYDETREFFQRYDVDAAGLLAAYDPSGRDDSVVRLLDLGLVRLFPDGTSETYTHELIQVRDLDACNREGTVRLRGEVLKIATIKADGTVYEPVRVSGEYVMPNLEPGDFIETITHTRSGAPGDGVIRLGVWFFTSVSQPFVLSRYVVSIPDEQPVQVITGNFDGDHDVIEGAAHTVHVFERRNGERVLTEPGVPSRRRFLPWVEVGMDAEWGPVLSRMRLGLDPMALVTPEIEAAAWSAVKGVVGQSARARALHKEVARLLDQRFGYPSPAVSALLAREGNPTVLYASLLSAVGIERDFVWSLNVPPVADEEADAPFFEPSRYRQRLLLVVRPDDGPAAWCDLAHRTLPYGHLLGDNSGAEAVQVETGGLLSVPMSDAPGNEWELQCRLVADGSADIQGRMRLLGGTGFTAREQLREYPEAYHQPIVQGVAARGLAGLDLVKHAITGLSDEDEQGVTFDWSGSVKRFLDGDDEDLSRPLPIPPLELGAKLAIEGVRRLPFLSPFLGIERTEVILQLDPGLELVDPTAGLTLSFGGWSYELSLVAESPGRWVLRREMRQQPFAIEAGEYADLVAFCVAVDDVEETRLHLRRLAGAR
jgi:tetratricopeptide (TPR) repeat protein